MAGRFGRFLRLEGPRKAEAGKDDASSAVKNGTDRFQAWQQPSQETAAPSGGAAPPSPEDPQAAASTHRSIEDRFAKEPPLLTIETVSTQELSFRRCVQCQADNGRYDSVCRNCAADLLGSAQRAFDELFAKRWLEAREAEAKSAAERQASGANAEGSSQQLADAQRRLGELLAEQVRRQVELEWADRHGDGSFVFRWERGRAGGIRAWLSRVEPFWLRLLLRLIYAAVPLIFLVVVVVTVYARSRGIALWPLLWRLFVGGAALVTFIYLARRRRN